MASKKVELKLRKPHPRKEYRLGRHKVTHLWASYELNEDEQKELKTAGPMAWIEKKKVKKFSE